MPDYIRAQCPGGTFFFTTVTYNRRPFLTTAVAKQLLKRNWQNIQKNGLSRWTQCVFYRIISIVSLHYLKMMRIMHYSGVQ